MQASLPTSGTPGIAQHSALSPDTRALMLFEANKKSALVAYILWVFLGLFGGHNFYKWMVNHCLPTSADA
jgi:hypothetical protein